MFIASEGLCRHSLILALGVTFQFISTLATGSFPLKARGVGGFPCARGRAGVIGKSSGWPRLMLWAAGKHTEAVISCSMNERRGGTDVGETLEL